MNHISSLLFILLMTNAVLAQIVPKKMNYQGVARDAYGSVVAEKTISLRIGIMSSENLGRPIFAEQHEVRTNKLGLFTLHIGAGEVLKGAMSELDWGSSEHYITVHKDLKNTGNFVEMGVSQLLTVPYAFYAERSGSLEGGGSRSDPNDWTINGNTGTNDAVSFIGTTDAQDLVFRTNGIEGMRLNVNGELDLQSGKRLLIGSRPVVSTIGSGNTFIGDLSGSSITTGYNNAFIGYKAGQVNTSGHSNAFIGFKAGEANTIGFSNTFIGQQSGRANTTGKTNVMIVGRNGEQANVYSWG